MYRVKTLIAGLSRHSHAKLLVSCRFCSNDSRANAASRSYATQAAAEPFLNGSSSNYVDAMFELWKNDPSSPRLHESWRVYFEQTAKGAEPAYIRPPTLGRTGSNVAVPTQSSYVMPPQAAVAPEGEVTSKDIEDHLAVQSIIRSYQIRGHHSAKTDPLGISQVELDGENTELSISHYNFGKISVGDESLHGAGVFFRACTAFSSSQQL